MKIIRSIFTNIKNTVKNISRQESKVSNQDKIMLAKTARSKNNKKSRMPAQNGIHKKTHHSFELKNTQSKSFFTDLLEKGFDTEVDWIIKNYLPANSFGMIYGASESFKSFHVISWAAAIATGSVWNGAPCIKSIVLYIAAEGGIGGSKRAQGWKEQHNDNKEISGLHAIKHPVNLTDALETQKLINTIHTLNSENEENVSIVFIDTLARCFGGADENRASDMSLFVSNCDKIKFETNVTVLIVHHTGKNKEREARGSSSLRAACDFEFNIDRPNKGDHYVLKCTKSKDHEPSPTESFIMTPHFLRYDRDGDEVTTLVPCLNGQENKVKNTDTVQALSEKQLILFNIISTRHKDKLPTDRQIVLDEYKAKGGDQKNFYRVVQQLINKGLITQSGEKLILSPINQQ